jgi:hypothetical protein
MLRDDLVGSSSHQVDDRQRGNQFLALLPNLIGSKDPNALKIPAPKGQNLH